MDMYDSGVSLIDLPAVRGNPFDNRPIESSRAQDLVGRKEMLRRWREHIHSGSPRMILLVGESGSGRTSMINAISSQTPKKYIGQFLSEENDQEKSVLHEILTHFTSFQSITTMNQLSQKLISLFDEEKGPLPIIALDYPPQVIEINSFLSRICPILSRLRAMVIVSLTESQLLELDDELRNLFDEPDRLENFTKSDIQDMVNNRMRLKSKEKWIINSAILNSIFQRTGGNPRDVIRILKCLVDEKRDLGYQGTLESLLSSQENKKPIVSERNYVEDREYTDNYFSELETNVSENRVSHVEKDDFIDEEPSDLWDYNDEEILPLSDNNESINEEYSLWDDNFPEIDESIVDDEAFIEEDNQVVNLPQPSEEINFQNEELENEKGLFMSPGTEPPEKSPLPSPRENNKFGFLYNRAKKTTSGIASSPMSDVPITYADTKPSQSTLDNYVNNENFDINNDGGTDLPIVTEAKVDRNIQSTDYEHIDSDEGAEWTVAPSYKSTVPKTISNPPQPHDESPEIEESFPEEPIFEDTEIEVPILQESEFDNSVELIESTPIYREESKVIITNVTPSKKSRFSPIWEQDKKLDIDRFYSLSDAERMILEVATLREISPSDDELQARLEVGRPRLSQLYNSLHKSGMLSVRKQGRTRLFKLSEAAANEF